MWLLVDDKRSIQGANITARTYQEGQWELQRRRWEGLYLDYMLDDEDNERTGLKLIQWAEKRGVLPAQVSIVSAFPYGRQLIENFLKEIGFTQQGDTWVRETPSNPRMGTL